LHGKRQVDIAALGVSRSVIEKDIAAIHRQWRQTRQALWREDRAREVARIDLIEHAAWERSCRDAEMVYAGKTGGRATKVGQPLPDLVQSHKAVKTQSGDPRFLERVSWCISKRCPILGLYQPQTLRLTPMSLTRPSRTNWKSWRAGGKHCLPGPRCRSVCPREVPQQGLVPGAGRLSVPAAAPTSAAGCTPAWELLGAAGVILRPSTRRRHHLLLDRRRWTNLEPSDSG
jgi:hypothetical protein